MVLFWCLGRILIRYYYNFYKMFMIVFKWFVCYSDVLKIIIYMIIDGVSCIINDNYYLF